MSRTVRIRTAIILRLQLLPSPTTTMATRSHANDSLSEVTDERPANSHVGKRAMHNDGHVIKVQPLKRSEMQVRHGYSPPSTAVTCIFTFSSLLTHKISALERCATFPVFTIVVSAVAHARLQVTHGIYGSMLQVFGSCIGFLGAIPCCPCDRLGIAEGLRAWRIYFPLRGATVIITECRVRD